MTTKMNEEDKRWRPTTTNNDNGNNQQWRQTMIKMRNAICLYWKPLLKFLCRGYEFLHAFFCPTISKVPTPNHDVRRSLVTAKDCITPDWCHHTLQASSAHALEQFPTFYIPYTFTFEVAEQIKSLEKWSILLGIIFAPVETLNAHLDLESCPTT